MSVRCNADGDNVRLPQINGPVTLAMWAKWYGIGAYSNHLIKTVIGASGTLLERNGDSDDILLNGNELHNGNPTVGDWYYVTYVWDGGTGDFVSRGSFTTATGFISLTNAGQYGTYDGTQYFWINSNLSSWADISVANVKMWTSALNASQLTTERSSKAVVLTSGLYCDAPFDVYTDLTDKSGGGHDWTGFGTLTTDSDPPWGGRNPVPMGFVLE